MKNQQKTYTATLGAGLGLVDETLVLLDLWQEGMDNHALYQIALDSGAFTAISASRLRNIVTLGFSPRYLCHHALPANLLKTLRLHAPMRVLQQLMFLYTARANAILYDFVRLVVWPRYAAGFDELPNETAREFVTDAVRDGKTAVPWSDSGKRRVAGYLTGCCADFGILEKGRKTVRHFLPFQMASEVAVMLAYDLHFAGLGDNAVIAHPDWELFGLEKEDVRDELKRLALKGFWIIQTAGESTRISWSFTRWEELIDGIAGR